MTDHKFFDPGTIDVSLIAEKVAAAVLVRRHDFMTWAADGQPETLVDEQLVRVIEEEVLKGLTVSG